MITSELKGLSIEQLKEKDSKYKELIEARDLEDILYKWNIKTLNLLNEKKNKIMSFIVFGVIVFNWLAII